MTCASVLTRDVLAHRLRPLPLLATLREPEREILAILRDIGGMPVDYIERLLHSIVSYLGLKWEVVRSSTLGVPDSLRGQDRIIEIARRLGATSYVNSPGGRSLYDTRAFEEVGIELRFLADYPGPSTSILRRILEEDGDSLTREILTSSQLTP